MYGVVSFAVLLAACLVQPSWGEVLNNGDVFQVYPALEDAPEGTTPLYFALMQSFSGGYVSAGGIPGLMVALTRSTTTLTSYLATPCTTLSVITGYVV